MFNKKIRALLYADIIWLFGEGMLGPLFAIFSQRVGGDVLDISWAWAVYLLVTGIIMVLVGKLSDHKIKKEKLVVIGYILNAIFTFSYLFVHNQATLFLVQAGLGLSAALATPTWNALYSENEDKRKDGSEWGLADGVSAIATGLAVIAGGLIVTYWSFTALFVIMGIIQVISVIRLLPILKK